MGWLDDLAHAGPVAGGFFGGPQSVAKFRAQMEANPVFSKYMPDLSDEVLAGQAWNANNPWEPINPSGQLRLNLGDPRFVEGATDYDWLQRMAEAQRTGPAEAQRQLRAWEQGYDPTQYYHTSPEAFDAFDLSKASTGANAGASQKERAVFLTDEPSIAETYIPDVSRRNIQNMHDKPVTYPLRVRGLEDFAVKDWGGTMYGRDEAWEHLEAAKKEGRPGVRWENILDPGQHAKIDPLNPPMPWSDPEDVFGHYPTSRVLGVFEPERLRSSFAQFDPKKRHLNDLLGGVGTVAAGGGALAAGTLGGTGEAEAGWMDELLRMGRTPHYRALEDSPLGFGEYLKPTPTPSIGYPEPQFLSGPKLMENTIPAIQSKQDRRLLATMDPDDARILANEAKRYDRSVWDIINRGYPEFTANTLKNAGFTGVRHGTLADPTGFTMADPRHVRTGEAAVRQALADQQGYDPRQFYHSGSVDFPAFDLGKASTGINKGFGPTNIDKERAVFMTPNPEQSASYLETVAQQKPLTEAQQKMIALPPDQANARWETGFREGSQTYPLRIRDLDRFSVLDMQGEGYSRDAVWPALANARAAGDPGMIFRNMRDAGPWSVPGADDPADVVAAFDPSLIRSAFAQFDPNKRHLNDLLAGVGGAAAAGGAGIAGLAASGSEAEAAGLPAPPPSNVAAKGNREPLPQVPDLTLTGAWPTPGADAAFPGRPTWLSRMADTWQQGRTIADKETALRGPPQTPEDYERLRAGTPIEVAGALGRGIAEMPKGFMESGGRYAAAMASRDPSYGSDMWLHDMLNTVGNVSTGGLARAAASRLAPGEAELGAFGSRRMALAGGGPKPGQMGEDAMRAAERRLYAAGRDPEELERIRQETGYFFTPGRRPEMQGGFMTGSEGPNTMYEMSDAGTDLNFPSGFGPGLGQRSNWSGRLGDIAEFPELFRQLPNLRTLPVDLHAGPSGTGAGGQYRYPTTGTPHDTSTGRELGSVEIWNAKEDDMTLRKLMHEGPGHAVDYWSGNPKGGNATDPGYYFKGGEVSANDMALFRLGMDDIDKFHDWPALARAYAEGRKVDEPLPWFPRPAGIGPQGQVERMWTKPTTPADQTARREEAKRLGHYPIALPARSRDPDAFRRDIVVRRELDRRIFEGKPFPWEPGGSPLELDDVAETWVTKGGQVRPGEKPGPKPGTMRELHRPLGIPRDPPWPEIPPEAWADILRQAARHRGGL